MSADQDRAGADRIRHEVGRVENGDQTRNDALMAVTPLDVEQVLHAQFDGTDAAVIATGLGASPGAAVGRVYFSADAAEDAYERGEDVLLVKQETSPEDVHGMSVAEGILTTRGGLASHAAVVARGWGKPAVCGAEAIHLAGDHLVADGVTIREGEELSIDGASGLVYAGAIDHAADEPCPELDELLAWADAVRDGKLVIRANADSGDDARRAREFGAEGIGLCRTEHQFLGDRLPAVQAMFMATDDAAEDAALDVLTELQEADFEALLTEMDGLPVTVRLLDPPLHEFLPDLHDLVVEEAAGTLTDERTALLSMARAWGEENPMLGTRGVRLGIIRPKLYRMQVRALVLAGLRRLAAGGTPVVEIMVPLIVGAPELALVRRWLEEEIDETVSVWTEGPTEGLSVSIGTMIETPRAALDAAAIAPNADFFSFGTNDLTQMTFGFSRDDIESRIMGTYLERELIDANPFDTIDQAGVGSLVASAVEGARSSGSSVKLGVCGEHGGDPASIHFFWGLGLDSVSCSPFRVPIARLAAAQAILSSEAV